MPVQRFRFAHRPRLPAANLKSQIDDALAREFGPGTVTLEAVPVDDPAQNAWLDGPADWERQPRLRHRARVIVDDVITAVPADS